MGVGILQNSKGKRTRKDEINERGERKEKRTKKKETTKTECLGGYTGDKVL
jgi:hypothetical protein